MPAYDEIYATLAGRAVAQGVVDVESFVQQMAASGVSGERITEMLLEDLESGGQIFGKFKRSLTGAASSASMSAVRQGEAVGYLDGTRAGRELARVARVQGSVVDAIDNADPQLAAALEDEVIGEIRHTWIAELINTCHRCLPLHGSTLAMREWKERGLHPDTIHSGWDSACHCRLVPQSHAEGRTELLAPLKRVKTPDGVRGFRKTQRAVSQRDVNASLAARDRALAFDDEGRRNPDAERTLRLLGQVNKDQA